MPKLESSSQTTFHICIYVCLHPLFLFRLSLFRFLFLLDLSRRCVPSSHPLVSKQNTEAKKITSCIGHPFPFLPTHPLSFSYCCYYCYCYCYCFPLFVATPLATATRALLHRTRVPSHTPTHTHSFIPSPPTPTRTRLRAAYAHSPHSFPCTLQAIAPPWNYLTWHPHARSNHPFIYDTLVHSPAPSARTSSVGYPHSFISRFLEFGLLSRARRPLFPPPPLKTLSGVYLLLLYVYVYRFSPDFPPTPLFVLSFVLRLAS